MKATSCGRPVDVNRLMKADQLAMRAATTAQMTVTQMNNPGKNRFVSFSLFLFAHVVLKTDEGIIVSCDEWFV